ncbi:MAG: hypothetical protein V9G11_06835 [Bifidobacterium adolescentis]
MFTKTKIVVSFGLMALLSACGVAAAPTPAPAATTLTVFAAASLTDAFNEVGKMFEAANPGAKVTFNYAGFAATGPANWAGAPRQMCSPAQTPRRWMRPSKPGAW